MPYVQAKDRTELYYYDWGTGTPVVLIHGWPLDSASWEYQARFLAENGYRVIAYDRRGFGRSGWPFTGYDYDTLAADLATILETLDLRGATIAGFSMGGGEVARYVASYRAERVAKAVLIGAVTPFLLQTPDNPDGVPGSIFDGIIDALKKDRADFLHNFWPKFYGRTLVHKAVSDPFLEFTQSMAMNGSPHATIELVRSWSATDFRADLAQFTIPTLIIHGTGDATVPVDLTARRSAALIPNAQLIEYDGEPHGLTATSADRLNADLLAFLRS